MGPSGGGKTYTALRLAKGIQAVLGGKIEVIDTESGRGKHYAEMFDYEYTALPPPHGSLDYLVAINHAVNVNHSRIVIVDSLSHEHEGEGGLIDYHDEEVARLCKGDWSRAESVSMLAWTKPKAARKQLLRGMLALGTEVVFILCFRADESSKPVKSKDEKGEEKTKVIQMGFMPIAGKPFVYEATVCALLMPGANGVPTWEPENVGERMMRKLPEQFRAMFEASKGKPITEDHGRQLAEWARGSSTARKEPPKLSLAERADAAAVALKEAPDLAKLEARWKKCAPVLAELEADGLGKPLDVLTATYTEQQRQLKENA